MTDTRIRMYVHGNESMTLENIICPKPINVTRILQEGVLLEYNFHDNIGQYANLHVPILFRFFVKLLKYIYIVSKQMEGDYSHVQPPV